jgi:hypothetical protein
MSGWTNLPVVLHRGIVVQGQMGCQKDCNPRSFSVRKEVEYYVRGLKFILEVFAKPNKFERELARMEHIPIPPSRRDLYANIVFTTDPSYFCAGSGGPGGGKVFWTPYTIQNAVLRKRIFEDAIIECDNVRVLSHELHHGIGGGAEFEEFNTIPAAIFRLTTFPLSKWGDIHWQILMVGGGYAMAAASGQRTQAHTKKRRLMFCAIYRRLPHIVKKYLIEKEKYTPEMIKKLDVYILK